MLPVIDLNAIATQISSVQEVKVINDIELMISDIKTFNPAPGYPQYFISHLKFYFLYECLSNSNFC